MGLSWKTLETWANRLGIWVTALSAMTAFFGWVASHLVAFKAYGWAEATFAGLFSTLAIVLVLSVGAMAWRLLRPLPLDPARQAAHKGGVPDISTPQLADDLRREISETNTKLNSWVEELCKRIESAFGAVAKVEQKIAIDLPNASTVQQAFQNLDTAVHSKLKRFSEENEALRAKLDATHLDVAHMLYFNILQATDVLIEHLISLNPKPDVQSDESSELNVEACEKNVNFLEGVAEGLSGTNRGDAYRNIMANAEYETDRRLSVLPPNQWPQGVNPVDLRRYFIAAIRRREMAAYMERQLAEVREQMRYSRSKLIERHELRSKPN